MEGPHVNPNLLSHPNQLVFNQINSYSSNRMSIPTDLTEEISEERPRNIDDRFRSIFEIESKYQEIKLNTKKNIIKKNPRISIDPPAIYSFKDLTGIPNQIEKRNINFENFLKARIVLDKKLELIGLSVNRNLETNANDLQSKLVDEINSLQNYKIQKSQKEFNDALICRDVFTQQPNSISPNDLNSLQQSDLVFLDKLKSSYDPNLSQNKNIQNVLFDICRNYDNFDFNIDQAVGLLQQLT